MSSDCWHQQHCEKLQRDAMVSTSLIQGMRNLAIRKQDVDIDFVTVRVLDLQFGENVSRPSCSRSCPRETQHTMIVSTSGCPELKPVDDYIWPTLSKTTGAIRLNRMTSTICRMVEWFAGGMSAWSQGCSALPVEVSSRVDSKTFAVQSLKIN